MRGLGLVPTQYRAGTSGNPSGRPAGRSDLARYMRTHTRDACDALLEIARDRDAPAGARVLAASAILDRGWGKPAKEDDVQAWVRHGDGVTAKTVLAAQLAAVGITQEQVAALARLRMEEAADGD